MNGVFGNFSTDLRRISDWYVEGNVELAEKFMKFCENKYKVVLNKKNIFYSNEFQKIKKEKDLMRKAERASTLSTILLLHTHY